MALQFPKNKFMCLVKVGEKGQIVIPKGARDLFDIQPGDQLLLMADKKRGIALVEIVDRAKMRLGVGGALRIDERGAERNLDHAALVRHGFLRLSRERDGHRLARRGPAPDRHRLPALQDHIVIEHVRQADIGRDRTGDQRGASH